MTTNAVAAVDAFNAAIKARSEAQLAAVYADHIIVWNNNGCQPMSKAESIAILGAVFRISSRLEYVNVRQQPIVGGILQQHCLVGTFADGAEMPPLEACILFTVADGRITRIEEYFDLSGYGPIFERIAALGQA